jgi:ABC-type multidrug transport system ATPase subunit
MQGKKLFFLSTHIMQEVEEYAIGAIINNGKIAADKKKLTTTPPIKSR